MRTTDDHRHRGPRQRHEAMNVAMSVGLVFAAILGAYLFVLWYGSATVIDKHEDRITVMERRWTEQFGGPKPAAELEPEAEPLQVYAGLAETDKPDELPTDEIPVAPPTVPDGMPLAVQSALIERPSPVPRGKSAAWVEEQIAAMRERNAERMARAITEEAS